MIFVLLIISRTTMAPKSRSELLKILSKTQLIRNMAASCCKTSMSMSATSYHSSSLEKSRGFESIMQIVPIETAPQPPNEGI